MKFMKLFLVVFLFVFIGSGVVYGDSVDESSGEVNDGGTTADPGVGGTPGDFAGSGGFDVLPDSFTAGTLAEIIYDFLFPIGIALGIIGIIRAGYTFLVSQGNPDLVKEGSENLTAAITGLLFIVLSLVLLRVIIGTLF